MRAKKEQSGHIDRRRLLTGVSLALGGAAATSAVAGKRALAATEERKPHQAGYRESEAVKTYYRLARY